MDQETFWTLMDGLSRHPGDHSAQLEWLRGELQRRPIAEVVEFQAHLEVACAAVATDVLWRAVNRIESGMCSDDGFDYFALWLVAQGRGTYEAVLADPDALADISEVRAVAGRHPREWCDHEWPEREELDYVAQEAFDELTGQEDDCGDAFYDALHAVQEAWAARGTGDGGGKASARSGISRLPDGTCTPRLDALFPAKGHG
ncbi:DUF4240 domain-containing protein [Streptomyces sp. NPDC051921]|uniref:DUF4240 domain-containing protein n=1 Tax=Streptomyces sp. NPDC051921 TaxID=3155806 RepID=UPI00344521AD